jgi:hypothetical protein
MIRYLLLLDSYGLVLWNTLSDERTGLLFVYAAGPCQRSVSRVRVHWYSRPYFTVSDLRLPFSSSPTTRRVTVEVFDPASLRSLGADPTGNTAFNSSSVAVMGGYLTIARISLTCLPAVSKQHMFFSRSLHSNGTVWCNIIAHRNTGEVGSI